MTIAALVVIVNIVTEVVKRTLDIKSAKVINIFVTVFSIVVSVISNVVYIGNTSLEGIITSIIGGFMVAYAAMFGYDKLLSYLEPFKGGKK